jgi:hypothetical protein
VRRAETIAPRDDSGVDAHDEWSMDRRRDRQTGQVRTAPKGTGKGAAKAAKISGTVSFLNRSCKSGSLGERTTAVQSPGTGAGRAMTMAMSCVGCRVMAFPNLSRVPNRAAARLLRADGQRRAGKGRAGRGPRLPKVPGPQGVGAGRKVCPGLPAPPVCLKLEPTRGQKTVKKEPRNPVRAMLVGEVISRPHLSLPSLSLTLFSLPRRSVQLANILVLCPFCSGAIRPLLAPLQCDRSILASHPHRSLVLA